MMNFYSDPILGQQYLYQEVLSLKDENNVVSDIIKNKFHSFKPYKKIPFAKDKYLKHKSKKRGINITYKCF